VALGAGAVIIIVVALVGIATLLGPKESPEPTGPQASSAAMAGTTVHARGGQWTNITPETLAASLVHKDFTLLNVKTPYVGEIAGTDLYIPYDELASRAGLLPADKAAPIVVYCRSGHESAIAAQTLLDLGYTNIRNLDGGMTAWTASGRQLVTVDRSGG
jgi:rhodanese-related sulfurtransferase